MMNSGHRLLVAVGLIVSGMLSAGAQQHQHSDEHISAFETFCANGPGNEAFCDCALEAVKTHLPPEHVALSDEGAFTVKEGLPEEIGTALDDAVITCRDTHVEFDNDPEIETDKGQDG